MAEPPPQTIELQRARSGQDLWPAVEAAQYARVIEPAPARTDAEAARTEDFVVFFGDCAEAWEGTSAADQTLALTQLGHRLAALGELALFVYWGVAQANFETVGGEPVELPVAVLAIVREDRPAITVGLPAATDTA